MAHYAEIDENNVVLRVIVVHNDYESEGPQYCSNLLGGNWVQTSYNANFRKNFAGIGYTYDTIRDAFVPPKPSENAVLNEDTCQWIESH